MPTLRNTIHLCYDIYGGLFCVRDLSTYRFRSIFLFEYQLTCVVHNTYSTSKAQRSVYLKNWISEWASPRVKIDCRGTPRFLQLLSSLMFWILCDTVNTYV